MLNLLKWNFIEFIKKNTWVFFGMILSLLLVVIPKNGAGILNNFLIATAAITGFIVFQAGIVIAIGYSFRWLEDPNNLLELSLPVPAWKQIVGKLAIAALVNLVSCVFFIQLFILISGISDNSVHLVTFENLSGIQGIVFFLIMIDATIQFSYITVRSFEVTRRASIFFTAIISSMVLITVTILIISIMSAANQIILPVISRESILTLNGSLQVMSTAIPLWTCLTTILLECSLGSLFLSKHFQIE